MKEAPPKAARRTRLPPEVRRRQIVEAAAAVVLEQGHLPIPLEALAARGGISKALVYAYFPTQFELFNAVLERRFAALAEAGVVPASRAEPLISAAREVALIYFDDVARNGPVIHVILRDQFMAGRLDPRLAAMRDRIVGNLARAARRAFGLGAHETVAAANMIIAIPEQAGRLAHAGELDVAVARALCAQLIESSIEALKPA